MIRGYKTWYVDTKAAKDLMRSLGGDKDEGGDSCEDSSSSEDEDERKDGDSCEEDEDERKEEGKDKGTDKGKDDGKTASATRPSAAQYDTAASLMKTAIQAANMIVGLPNEGSLKVQADRLLRELKLNDEPPGLAHSAVQSSEGFDSSTASSTEAVVSVSTAAVVSVPDPPAVPPSLDPDRNKIKFIWFPGKEDANSGEGAVPEVEDAYTFIKTLVGCRGWNGDSVDVAEFRFKHLDFKLWRKTDSMTSEAMAQADAFLGFFSLATVMEANSSGVEVCAKDLISMYNLNVGGEDIRNGVRILCLTGTSKVSAEFLKVFAKQLRDAHANPLEIYQVRDPADPKEVMVLFNNAVGRVLEENLEASGLM
mmetsp:Transcript_74110/g.147328  ORF Transcript_74110/g.147328 Transcript_74110/m.147328 type:complete len:366 (-) Transcript_74110:193-1290(-)